MQATLSPQQRGELMVGEPVAADHGEADEEADELAGEVVEGVGELAHVPAVRSVSLTRSGAPELERVP